VTPDPEVAAFERRPVISVEGMPYDDIDFLAGDLVVYLHDEIPTLFDYSRESLVGLDQYFARNPLTANFKRRFLERQLLPAVGAYFAKVLVQALGGRWLPREPIGMTAVEVGGCRIIPFRVAFDVAREGISLASIFDVIARGGSG
jgi:hypothetical protein